MGQRQLITLALNLVISSIKVFHLIRSRSLLARSSLTPFSVKFFLQQKYTYGIPQFSKVLNFILIKLSLKLDHLFFLRNKTLHKTLKVLLSSKYFSSPFVINRMDGIIPLGLLCGYYLNWELDYQVAVT